MKKTLFTLLMLFTFSVASHAQFEKGKVYFATGLSGLDINFNSTQKWKLDAGVKTGVLFADNWMVTAQGEYNYRRYANDAFNIGVGMRYYIVQNGLYLGLGANYKHERHYDDIMPTAQVGYAFFLSRTVTIEPEVYYNQSLESHSKYSGVGFRLGFGIYL